MVANNDTNNMDAEEPNLVDWTPVYQSGASFQTHKFEKRSEVRVDFIPTSGFVAFSLFFLISGLFILTMTFFYLDAKGNFYVALIVGLLFFLTGTYLLFISSNRIILQKKDGVWSISRNNVFSKRVKFSIMKPLHAIQVLEKSYDSNTSYELNIIYKDGSRENILNQANGTQVITSAAELAKLIGLPFLNGVKTGIPFSKWGEFRPQWGKRKAE